MRAAASGVARRGGAAACLPGTGRGTSIAAAVRPSGVFDGDRATHAETRCPLWSAAFTPHPRPPRPSVPRVLEIGSSKTGASPCMSSHLTPRLAPPQSLRTTLLFRVYLVVIPHPAAHAWQQTGNVIYMRSSLRRTAWSRHRCWPMAAWKQRKEQELENGLAQ